MGSVTNEPYKSEYSSFKFIIEITKIQRKIEKSPAAITPEITAYRQLTFLFGINL